MGISGLQAGNAGNLLLPFSRFQKIRSRRSRTMIRTNPDTEELIARARKGDRSACELLLVRHRDRLGKMVAVRLDRRMTARVDPSDVVQEALLEASQKLPDYLRRRPVPFYPWLRRFAWEHLIKLRQRHLAAQKRSASREELQRLALSDESVLNLAQRLVASGTSPSNRLIRKEQQDQVRAALAQLPDSDREVLIMRYLEQLSMTEIAAVLEVSEGAAKMRHTRALRRLSNLFGGNPLEDIP
jgi:RNA polymerase sigma-70 factor (ECF subfamily)